MGLSQEGARDEGQMPAVTSPYAEPERISAEELRLVLAEFDLGALFSAKTYPRGSRKSPKLLLRAEKGDFLLKRRAVGKDEMQRVSFTHALIEYLRSRRFPVPELVHSRTNETLVRQDDRVYELFRFVAAHRFAGSLPEAEDAGRTLARFHQAVAGYRGQWLPESRSYHDRPEVRTALQAIPNTISGHESVVGFESELLMVAHDLERQYDRAAALVNDAGIEDWPRSLTHGDWHPGNLLFENQRVTVVLDFDAVRPNAPTLELANAMLQFSVLRDSDDPDNWPAHFDETRMRRVLIGYLQKKAAPANQRRIIPLLMIEALIAETAVPIAVTGSFGHMPGMGVLRMAQRKVRWLLDNQARLDRWMTE